jgi:hypothetical protein
MADLLAAASLLLTVVTVLYSLWYPEVAAASKREIKQLAANRTNDFDECRAVLFWKAVPLCLVTILLVFINGPDTWVIVTDAVAQIGKSQPESYSAIRTTFVAVVTILVLLASHMCAATIALGHRVWKLDPARGDS